jgi:hypothetical protein
MHLMNIRHVAWGKKELSSLRKAQPAGAASKPPVTQNPAQNLDISPEQIAEITRKVMERLGQFNS